MCFNYYESCILIIWIIYDALHNMVPFIYNLKNVKNTHGGVLLLVSLQTSSSNFTKSNTPPWVFFTFLKLYKRYQIAQSISIVWLKVFFPKCKNYFYYSSWLRQISQTRNLRLPTGQYFKHFCKTYDKEIKSHFTHYFDNFFFFFFYQLTGKDTLPNRFSYVSLGNGRKGLTTIMLYGQF